MQLDEKHLLVDASKTGEPYTYGTLQAASAAAGDHTTIYLAPDVYWTDDPEAENTENHLVGLTLTAEDLHLVGLGKTPEETVICGDRGQMNGAIGNWNTIGIAGSDFKAENITFGNYCNVDLEYAPDPSKNHKKRCSSITQAQVILPVGAPDRWVFERCRFVSLLNVFAYNDRMGRVYYKDCFFQSTDDAIGTGDVNVFENCHFVWYSNHPSGSACETLLVYAGCHFEGKLLYEDFDDKVYLSKAAHRSIVILDSYLSGNVKEVWWCRDDHWALRCCTYANSFEVNPAHPENTLRLEEYPEQLKAYKVGDRYNVWNLLRGEDDWDPAHQKETMEPWGEIPWRMRLTPVEAEIPAGESLRVKVQQYRCAEPLTWSVDSDAEISWHTESDILVLENPAEQKRPGMVNVVARTPQGLEGAGQYKLGFRPSEAPVLQEAPVLVKKENTLTVSYELEGQDDSRIGWYRSSNGENAQAVLAARGKEPYRLTCRDNGYFLLAGVEPKTLYSERGEICWSEPLWIDGVEETSYHTDFSDLPVMDGVAYTGPSDVPEYAVRPLREGFWQVGVGRPLDYPDKFHWYPRSGASAPWTYGRGGEDGQESAGLMTTHRGSKLLFPQQMLCRKQKQRWVVHPAKVAGQGFGSPTGQYLDLYIGLDAFTMTGYGVRVERTPKYSNGVDFQLYAYNNEVGTPISEAVSTGCFRGDCEITMTLEDGKLTLDAVNNLPLLQSHIDCGLTPSVHLEAQVGTAPASGWGCWHTGTGTMIFKAFDYEAEA